MADGSNAKAWGRWGCFTLRVFVERHTTARCGQWQHHCGTRCYPTCLHCQSVPPLAAFLNCPLLALILPITILSLPVLSYPIISNANPSFHRLCRPILSYPTPPHPILSYSTLPNPTLPYPHSQGLKPGDRVAYYSPGPRVPDSCSYAGYSSIPVETVVKLPDGVSFDQGASVLLQVRGVGCVGWVGGVGGGGAVEVGGGMETG